MTASRYTALPRAFLLNPPIAHRHTPDEEDLLTTFETDIVCALIAKARWVFAKDVHKRSWQGGAEAIKREVQTSSLYSWKRDWSELTGKRVEPKGPSIKTAGRSGYAKRKQSILNRPLPDSITVTITRSALLTSAALSPNDVNLGKLEAALNGLCKPFGPANGRFAPLLRRWEKLASGQLVLHVSGGWLQPPFGKVPMPLPARSPTAKALYLFLHTIRTGPLNKTPISLQSLCIRLGIPTRWGKATASEAVSRALAIVNEHLNVIRTQHPKLPSHYVPDRTDEGKIRFVAMPPLPARAQPSPKRPSLPRVRIPPDVMKELEHREWLSQYKWQAARSDS